MTPRSHSDFSLWPERARPTRRRFSATRLLGIVSAGLVCVVASYAVVSELMRPTALQEPIGRSWQDYSASEPTGTVGVAPARAQEPPPAAVSAPIKATEPVKRTRSVASPTALTAIGTAGPASATDGRSVPDGRPRVDPAATPAAGKASESKAVEPKPAEPPKEAIVAADEDKPAAEKPKRTKKVRKKTRTETGQAPWGGDYRRAEAYPRQGYGPGWGPRPGGFFPY